MPKKIIFISKGEDAVSTRYRALSYFPYLKKAGWTPEHITASAGIAQRIGILKKASAADVVVVLRKTFSGFYLKLLRRAAKRLIFDFDDAVFVRSNGQASRLRMNRFKRMVQASDQVWAGNSHLAGQAQRYTNAVALLATSIDPEKYALDTTKPAQGIHLVWIGSRSTRKYLVEALPVLETLSQKLPGLRLKIIANFDLSSPTLKTIPVAWSAANEAYETASAHIGIAPMPDNPWTQGKCGLKVLQYMAVGLPVVSSSVGVNKDFVRHNVTGLLADTPEEWIEAIERLASDPELRQKMGEEGRKRAMSAYSLSATFNLMKTALEKL